MATKIEGWQYQANTGSRYFYPESASVSEGHTRATLIDFGDGPPERCFTESELEAERKSNRELVQAALESLDQLRGIDPFISDPPMRQLFARHFYAGVNALESALASSKGITPTL